MKFFPYASGLRRVAPYLSQVRRSYLLALVLIFLGSALTATKAWMIQPAVDKFIAGQVSGSMLWLLCGFVALVFVGQAILEWLYLVVYRSANVRVTRDIRGHLFDNLLR